MSQQRRISITLPSDLVRRLGAAAESEGVSPSKVVEAALEYSLTLPDLDRVEGSLVRAQQDLDLLLAIVDTITEGAEPLLPDEGGHARRIPDELRDQLAERLRGLERGRVGHG
jgi:predicted transcriptional regulator